MSTSHAVSPDADTWVRLAPYRPCIVIPFYRHEQAITAVIDRLKPFGLDCWIVDDGSGEQSRGALHAIAAREASWVHLHQLAQNCGKGAAVMSGCACALARGYTHAVQIDADGQHNVADLPRLLECSRAQPHALVTGIPVFDASVPRVRFYGRYLTYFWVWVETLSFEIRDSMCGFRVYPLATTISVWNEGNVGRRMDFDTGIMVHMFWRGVRVLSVPTKVTYPADGVSHFRMLRDNLRLTWMHLRLLLGMGLRAPRLTLGRRRQ
ncbi:glycosyltransferase family 2 protein [Panacagrimonas sp.]|uniref:glycosyltransferase family 2 protein n=1 Tax=Panacagrimonas sp. TaxID=2480088 RepID=UPI003B52A62A